MCIRWLCNPIIVGIGSRTIIAYFMLTKDYKVGYTLIEFLKSLVHRVNITSTHQGGYCKCGKPTLSCVIGSSHFSIPTNEQLSYIQFDMFSELHLVPVGWEIATAR